MSDVILKATYETLYMVIGSTFFAVILGFVPAIILTLTAPDGLKPNKVVYTILDILVNIFRSFPFVILMVIVIPLTRLIAGKAIGTTAALVPLTISAIPFVARVIESALRSVDVGLIEAAKSFGASDFQIIYRIYLKEAFPAILSGITLTMISIIGYSAMGGALGAGGLGDIAIRYGYQAYKIPYLVVTSIILIISEFCDDGERHIVSVFKLVQDLLKPSGIKGKTQFQILLDYLPDNHKAKWFAGAALNTGEQAMMSVLSTVLSRLNAFIDSEIEQILCFETTVDIEKFCSEKSAIFLVMPEEDNTKHFLISLFIQQYYREMLACADSQGGRLKRKVIMYLDEIGTIPKIESAEMMFSASRSRNISIVAIIQSLAQLEKNYGKEGASIIVDNCQDTLFGGFAPNSETAKVMSENLGSKTVMSGSVSKGKNDPSQSLQMIERPLMTTDELKSMPKGHFILLKTGMHPMRTVLRLFIKWKIKLDKEYQVNQRVQREVKYADINKITSILKYKFEKDDNIKFDLKKIINEAGVKVE